MSFCALLCFLVFAIGYCLLPWLRPEGGNFPNMFCQFMILEIFPYYTAMVWYIRVTAQNGGTHLKKPKNGVFQYLDTPPTLRPKNSIKELTDLVNFFICTLKLIHLCSNKIILRLKVMRFRLYKGLKIGNFQ